MINKDNKNNINLNKANVSLLKDDVKKLKIEYEKEIEKYKIASRSIIETEEKFNNVSKKINKINYKQMIMTNKINNDYIENLNECKLEQNIKITILSLFGFPFPNQEPFYFTSPEDLIAQLSISKDFLFNLVLTNKSEFEKIKSSFDHLNKNLIILRPIYDYMKLNFDIVNLMQKRENIFQENKNFIQSKDSSLINVKTLEKKIKEKYSLIKNRIKSTKTTNQKISKEKNNINDKEKEFDELLNDSHLLSIKDFDEISGKSLLMSTDNDNSILGFFNEEEIKKFEIDTNKINYNYYFDGQTQTFNNDKNKNKINNFLIKGIKERNADNKIDIIKKMQNLNIFTEEEEEKDINNIIQERNKIFIKKYRSPQFKEHKEKDILRIEKSVGDSGCCASCT
jgi:hypothetical protein